MSARSSREPLPLRPHPDWYRKAAKQALLELRAADPHAQLSDAQLNVARACGFPSWRALIAAIAARRGNDADVNDKTSLHAAAGQNDAAAIERLLASGADAERRYSSAGHTPLSWAVTMGAFDAAHALVAGGAATDLYCAAAMGDLAAVRSFFTADGGLTARAGHTCHLRFLSLATRREHRRQTRDLVSDAMYAAVRHVRIDVARFLIERHVDLQSRGFHGATLLHWAHYAGSEELVSLLISHGAAPNERDDTFDCSPRAFAICAPARLGNLVMVRECLERDRSLATINEGRGTPLHEAVRGGHEAIVRLLLESGADPGARDDRGRTAFELADRAAGPWLELVS